MGKIIVDEFTDLPVSRQRKHQLRHPEKLAELKRRYHQTDKGKAAISRANLKYREKLKAVDKGIDTN